MRFPHLLSVLAALAAVGPAQLGAQTSRPTVPFTDRWKLPAAKPAAQTGRAATKPATQLPVSLEQALYLIRSSLLTLNDADKSGNYTVLRDLAAPGFQQKNSAADLSAIFANLRNEHVDLFASALAAPQLSAPPHLEKGMLRLTGHFPSRPWQINFDLLFANVAGHWRLFGISVATPMAQPVEAEARRPNAIPSK